MRWLILAVLFLARTAMAFQFQTVGSLSSTLVDALAIDHARLGTLIGLYMLPGVAIALPGGVLGRRFGDKTIVLVGLALMASGGAVMGLIPSFTAAAGGRITSGMGAALLNVLLTKMLVDWFAGREIVTAMAILISSWPLGIGIGLVTFGPLAAAYSWSVAMDLGAGAAAGALILMAILYRDAPRTSGRSAGRALRLRLSAREWVLVSFAGLVWTTYNVGYIILISFTPDLLTERGYSVVAAGLVVSLAGWALIPTVPASGYLAERFGRPNLIMGASFVVTALAMTALPYAGSPVALFVAIALAIGPAAGLIMALPAEALTPENRAPGMGLYYTWYYAGMAAMPGVAGFTRDVTGNVAAPLVFAAVMLGAAAVFLAGFRGVQRRWPSVGAVERQQGATET